MYWITGDDREVVDEELSSCAEAGLRPQGGHDGDIPHNLAALAREALHEPIHRLLILDACESERTLEYLRPTSGGCCILVSSSRTRWPPALGAEHPLGDLGDEVSEQLLRTFRPYLSAAQARAIAMSVGGRALALHLAGRYLARHDEISAWAFLEQLKLEKQPAGHSPPWLTLAIDRSLNELYGDADRGALALLLLERAAACAPRWPMSAQLLAASLEPPGAEMVALRAALDRLVELGLILEEREGEPAPRRYLVHPLVADYLSFRSGRTQAAIAVARALIEYGEECLRENKPASFRDLVPHIVPLTRTSSPLPDNQQADLAKLFARYYQLIGLPARAEEKAKKALELYERSLSEAALRSAVASRDLGIMAWESGDLPLAVRRLETARALADDWPNQHNVWILRVALCYDLALLKKPSGVPEAVKLLDEAVAVMREAGYTSWERLGDLYNERGYLNFLLGQYDAARADLREALSEHEKKYGLEHPLVATTLRYLGSVEIKRGEHNVAKGLLQRALRIRHAENADLPETVACVLAMHECLVAMGALADARALI